MSDTNHNEERERLTKFALRAYEKLPGNRAYALDEQGAMALGALACAWHERGNKLDNSDGGGEDQFGEVLKKLGAFTNLFQQQAAEPKPLRKMWADPITGQLLKNPFSSATQKLSAQKLIMERDPDLAAALKKSAENPWQFVADLQDEA